MFNFFLIFLSISFVWCVLGSILSRNTIHSILFLILVFCNASGLLLILNLDYLAMIYVVVYIGAIAILFLFVVMMLNVKLLEVNDLSFWSYLPLGLFISSVLFYEFYVLFSFDYFNSMPLTTFIGVDSDLLVHEIDLLNFYAIDFFFIKGLIALVAKLVSFNCYELLQNLTFIDSCMKKGSKMEPYADIVNDFPYILTTNGSFENSSRDLLSIENEDNEEYTVTKFKDPNTIISWRHPFSTTFRYFLMDVFYGWFFILINWAIWAFLLVTSLLMLVCASFLNDILAIEYFIQSIFHIYPIDFFYLDYSLSKILDLFVYFFPINGKYNSWAFIDALHCWGSSKLYFLRHTSPTYGCLFSYTVPSDFINNDIVYVTKKESTKGINCLLYLDWTMDILKFNSNDFQYTDWIELYSKSELIISVGSIMYSFYFFAFLLSSLILLIAMMGSILLTLTENNNIKNQVIFEQITRTFSKSITK
jgi:NADH:ubiquinone oxidoreductase subunit 6 (subunit J)